MSPTFPFVSTEPGVFWPGVSIIVAARNAASTLTQCLESLRALDYPDTEIIVVDDGSVDDTAAIVRGAGVRLLSSPRPGPSAARNFGVTHATHEIVAFTDADCVVSRHWLRSLVEGLRTARAAGAGGPQRNVFPATADQSARDLDLFFSVASTIAEYTRADDCPRVVDHNASCNVAYIKHTIVEAGGFAEDLFPGEDVDLDFKLQRLGYTCYYVPDAWVEHHRPGTRQWFAGMMRRYGQAQRALVDRHGRFRPLHYLPLATLALTGAQILWLPRRTRPVVAAIDGLLIVGALAALARRVPVARWAAVLDYASIALREWHSGYAEGLPTTGPSGPPARQTGLSGPARPRTGVE